MIDSFQITK